MKKQFTCLLASTLLLSGCSSNTQENQTESNTQLNQEQSEILESINEAYIKTTSQSYTEMSYIQQGGKYVDDTFYVNYLYAVDEQYALEYTYCFDYKFNKVVNFNLTMPSQEVQSIENSDYSYTADYYFTNCYYDYIIYDINEAPSDISSINEFQITGDPTATNASSLVIDDKFSLNYVTNIELVDDSNEQKTYKVEETFDEYTVSTTIICIDSQGYVIYDMIEDESGLAGHINKYISDVPDFNEEYEKSHSILNTNLLENDYLIDLENQYSDLKEYITQ